MSALLLKAEMRDKNVSNKTLRNSRTIPGELYGHKIKNQSVSVPLADFSKVYKEVGENILIDLAIEKQAPIKVLIHDITRDVETHVVEHIDFYQVNMNEKITTEIPIVFTGESDAVKILGGVLITQIESIPVKCLPSELVREFTIDLGVLTDYSKRISLSDIQGIPDSMEVLRDMDSTVALVSAPRVIVEDIIEETTDEAVTEDGVVEKEGEKKEGEESKGTENSEEKLDIKKE
jgi:large subunit ribosomal protein L25